MRKLLSAVTVLLFVLSLTIPATAEEVSVGARAFELYCTDNASVLLSDSADEKLPMASTTKIMTTLITLEHASMDNKIVEFTDDMTAEGSSMYLKVGEKVMLYDLAVGMMMQSGNDAANAAAIAIAGSIEDFAVLMNEKAAEIGMTHTHFVTPSGLDDDDHYSTAHDMALLMAYALQNEDFAEITSQTQMSVDFIEPQGKRVTYPNHNKLLRICDSCIGGKTGYTDMAGRCLVSAAKKDGMTLIAVTLDDHDDWQDHIALYDWGFDRYTAITPELDLPEMDVVGGAEDSVDLYMDAKPLIVPKDRADDVRTRLYLPSFAYAPVESGEEAGRIICTLDGDEIGSVSVKYNGNIAYDSRPRSLWEWLKDFLKIT